MTVTVRGQIENQMGRLRGQTQQMHAQLVTVGALEVRVSWYGWVGGHGGGEGAHAFGHLLGCQQPCKADSCLFTPERTRGAPAADGSPMCTGTSPLPLVPAPASDAKPVAPELLGSRGCSASADKLP